MLRSIDVQVISGATSLVFPRPSGRWLIVVVTAIVAAATTVRGRDDTSRFYIPSSSALPFRAKLDIDIFRRCLISFEGKFSDFQVDYSNRGSGNELIIHTKLSAICNN